MVILGMVCWKRTSAPQEKNLRKKQKRKTRWLEISNRNSLQRRRRRQRVVQPEKLQWTQCLHSLLAWKESHAYLRTPHSQPEWRVHCGFALRDPFGKNIKSQFDTILQGAHLCWTLERNRIFNFENVFYFIKLMRSFDKVHITVVVLHVTIAVERASSCNIQC